MKLRRWIGTLAIAMIIFFAYGMPSYAANPESEFHFSNYNDVGTITGYTGTSKEIVIPETINGIKVQRIDYYAFRGQGLTSVELPDTINEIGVSAFESNALKSIVLPESLMVIENGAFSNNQLVSIALPSEIKRVGGFFQ